jgi:hypothetical protein
MFFIGTNISHTGNDMNTCNQVFIHWNSANSVDIVLIYYISQAQPGMRWAVYYFFGPKSTIHWIPHLSANISKICTEKSRQQLAFQSSLPLNNLSAFLTNWVASQAERTGKMRKSDPHLSHICRPFLDPYHFIAAHTQGQWRQCFCQVKSDFTQVQTQ